MVEKRVVILGGAGFIGSNIACFFAARGWRVSVIDGLMPHTSADRESIEGIENINFFQYVTDEVPDKLSAIISGCNVVIDALGWTKHVEAMRNPCWDMRLNLASHLPVIEACKVACQPPEKIFFLASRHQYGRTNAAVIDENTPMQPVDVQGIHKVAAESHWRLAANEITRTSVLSLRFGNTFGPRMPVGAGDSGLIGGFIYAARTGQDIRIFGANRTRDVLFVQDLARIVFELSQIELEQKFQALNIGGEKVTIQTLAEVIIDNIGGVKIIAESLPDHIARIDIGEADLDNTLLARLLGDIQVTPFADAMRETLKEMHFGC